MVIAQPSSYFLYPGICKMLKSVISTKKKDACSTLMHNNDTGYIILVNSCMVHLMADLQGALMSYGNYINHILQDNRFLLHS